MQLQVQLIRTLSQPTSTNTIRAILHRRGAHLNGAGSRSAVLEGRSERQMAARAASSLATASIASEVSFTSAVSSVKLLHWPHGAQRQLVAEPTAFVMFNRAVIHSTGLSLRPSGTSLGCGMHLRSQQPITHSLVGAQTLQPGAGLLCTSQRTRPK